MDQQSCPTCGMKRDTWPDRTGVTKVGKTYCCKGCAEGTGCTCPQTADSSSERNKAMPGKLV